MIKVENLFKGYSYNGSNIQKEMNELWKDKEIGLSPLYKIFENDSPSANGLCWNAVPENYKFDSSYIKAFENELGIKHKTLRLPWEEQK